MTKHIKEMLLILSLTLVGGIFINQLHPQGIRWELLLPLSANAPTTFTSINPEDAFLALMQEEAHFIDIRPAEEFEADHIAGAISLPLFDYFQSPDSLRKLATEKKYILYCFDPECKEAEMIAAEMIGYGFQDVAILEGGLSAWLGNGFPTEL